MNFISELKRRNVFKVAAAYLIVSWLILQIISSIVPIIEAPDWVAKAILMLLIAGFPIALLFAWAFELTPEGIKKESEVDRDESITSQTSSKINVVIIGALVLIIGGFVYDKFFGLSATIELKTTEHRPEVSNADKSLKDNLINNKSIAVLPFTNMANNPESEPITVGLHDDLLTHISKISALKVISRTSVLAYKGTTKKIGQIAKELGVANILEGGVQKSGNQIRVNVQLIDAQTDQHLWAEIYDRELTAQNIFKIQSEISEKVAAALKAQLTPAESISLTKIPTQNLQAYNAYLAARQLIAKREAKSLKQALSLFQKATQLDPNYALAYVGQAFVFSLLVDYSDLTQEEMFALGEPLIAKALDLEPLLAAAHTIKGVYLSEKKQYQAAEKNFKYALSLNPNDAETYHLYAAMLRKDLVRVKEALVMHRKAAELDPLSNVILVNLGYGFMANGKLQEALTLFESVHRLNPKFPGALNGLAWANSVLGNYTQAVIQQKKSLSLVPEYIRGRFWLFLHYLNIGDIPTARAELAQATAIAPRFSWYPYQKSVLELLSGNDKAAQQRFISLHKQAPENKDIKDILAIFSLMNNECQISVEMWQGFASKILASDYALVEKDLADGINLAWCLNQTGQKPVSEKLLAKIQNYLTQHPIRTNPIQYRFLRASFLAVQGKNIQAAKAYAQDVKSNKTQMWYFTDHLPYFAQIRKEPIFIKAQQQLMQDLQIQRERLDLYFEKENL